MPKKPRFCEAGVRTGGDRKLEAQHSREKQQETAMHISTLLWNIMTCWPFSRLFCCDLSSVERALDQRNSGINPSTVKRITWLRAAALLESPASPGTIISYWSKFFRSPPNRPPLVRTPIPLFSFLLVGTCPCCLPSPSLPTQTPQPRYLARLTLRRCACASHM